MNYNEVKKYICEMAKKTTGGGVKKRIRVNIEAMTDTVA